MAVCPRPKSGARQKVWDGYADAMTSRPGWELFVAYDVTTPKRMAMFLGAVVAPETGMTVLRESGAYTADGILRIFGAGHHSAKVEPEEARRIAALPVNPDGSGPRCEALFERVYGIKGNPKKARDLGNTQVGDGWRCRGLGLNQMTGRAAQLEAAAEIGCSLTDLATPLNALHMALIEWDEKGCNTYADTGDVISVRKLINGGNLKVSVSRINGIPEARRAYAVALKVITDDDFTEDASGSRHDVAAAAVAAPLSLMHSTETQAAVTTGGGGVITTGQGVQNAAMTTASSGDFTWKAFALNLMAEPLFWAGISIVAGSAYWFLKRRWRFYVQGV